MATDENDLDDESDADAGTLLEGGAPPPPTLGWGWHWQGSGLVPPFPGVGVVEAARVPPPRRLDGADTAEEWRAVALAALANVTAWVYGRRRVVAYRHAEVAPGTPGCAQLDEACRALFEEETPPAMWVRFRLADHFQRTPDASKRTLPWRFIYDARKIHANAGWFRSASSTYAIAPTMLTATHRELVALHSAMTAELAREGAHNPEAVRAIVARYFPAGTWAMMVARAKAEALRLQRELDEKAMKGAVLWV